MPELPEVETVKETLKTKILHKKIIDVNIYYPNIIEQPNVEEFKKKIINQTIQDMQRRGKWLIFILDDYALLSHLRMEGKYNIKDHKTEIGKHEHVSFILDDNTELRYQDTRKFGRMHLLSKENIEKERPLNELGLEPWSEKLTPEFLKEQLKNKTLPIKTILLDQSIITGIGNIYADEILFLSKINPYLKGKNLNHQQFQSIIDNTRKVLEEAIKMGGTTIRSFTSQEGVHGRFQQSLHVHNQKTCPICKQNLCIDKINGRSTYYCPTCQK